MAAKPRKTPANKPRAASKDPTAEELRAQPIHRSDHPELGVAGVREIYRHGDVGFVADIDKRGVVSVPYCTIRPVRFTGVEVTSWIQTGPDEYLRSEAELIAKLKKDLV